jgi:hypothetical protein
MFMLSHVESAHRTSIPDCGEASHRAARIAPGFLASDRYALMRWPLRPSEGALTSTDQDLAGAATCPPRIG